MDLEERDQVEGVKSVRRVVLADTSDELVDLLAQVHLGVNELKVLFGVDHTIRLLLFHLQQLACVVHHSRRLTIVVNNVLLLILLFLLQLFFFLLFFLFHFLQLIVVQVRVVTLLQLQFQLALLLKLLFAVNPELHVLLWQRVFKDFHQDLHVVLLQ